MTRTGAKILVVDDDVAIRDLVGKRLEHIGYEVVQAETGEQALEIVATRSIDLVLLDIMMPGMDGFEVLERIRQRYALSSLPVIMLSAKDKSESVIRALRIGANDYAVKPVDFSILLKRVDVHLALKTAKGRVIGGYAILRKIGSGGMGIVYEANHVETGQTVALKVLPRSLTIDETFVKRFMRESEIAERVDHPNIVKILGAGKDDETYFMVMELVHGKNLGKLCESGPIEAFVALRIARQVAAALGALKATGIIHRDIKPENVIVDDHGIAKITDFGIARETVATGRMTDTGVGVGSILYASPEQIQGEGDHRSDIYSLGCTLYFMLTGVDPFDADQPVEKVLMAKLRQPPRLSTNLSGVPRAVSDILRRMLAPKPERRYQTYLEIEAAIDGILSGSKSRIRDAGRSVVWAGAGLAAVLIALALWGLWHYG